MKIVQINATCGIGSTGKICVAVSKLLSRRGVENTVFYSHGKSDYEKGVKYATLPYTKLQALKSRVLGNYGFNSALITRKLIKTLDKMAPDVVHLHNLHAHNVHLERLFDYLKKKKIKVFWTFHDCWAFTAYCPYFNEVNCDKWQKACHDCPLSKRYSWFLDRSSTMFERKKKMIQGLDLTVVTPSRWLADLVKTSIFKDYPVRVQHNGINLDTFRPRESDFRARYSLEDKFVILGVAHIWDARKGIDVFCELAGRLDDRFRIVLVGTNDEVDKVLPQNIVSIHRTENQIALAEIYTASDLFVNPTREDNYPTVNMEALACGTPVVTFDTGGSREIPDESCGMTVPCGDVDAMEKAILAVAESRPFNRAACLARAAFFDEDERFANILSLYDISSYDNEVMKEGMGS